MSQTTGSAWGAVIAMSLGIFGIVGAEFLPASLLTPIAVDLGITEGMAGQTVTVTAALAFVTSLTVSAVTGKIDRRRVLVVLSVLLVISNVLVWLAPDLTTLLLARMMLGISLGGFWSLAPATIMRLFPASDVPKALAILFGGVSAATVFAAPFASFFEDAIGWRGVFLTAAGLGLVALVAQLLTLPLLAAQLGTRFNAPFIVLRRPKVGVGILSVLLVFTGHFAFFTYLRPFLEAVADVNAAGRSRHTRGRRDAVIDQILCGTIGVGSRDGRARPDPPVRTWA